MLNKNLAHCMFFVATSLIWSMTSEASYTWTTSSPPDGDGYQLISDTGSSRTYRLFAGVEASNWRGFQERIVPSLDYFDFTLHGDGLPAAKVTVTANYAGHLYIFTHGFPIVAAGADMTFAASILYDGGGKYDFTGFAGGGKLSEEDKSNTTGRPGSFRGNSFGSSSISEERFYMHNNDVLRIDPSLRVYIESNNGCYACIGDADMTADFGNKLATNGMFFTILATPVPEPETYAMLLAGLGLLGFTVHRRKENP